QRQHHDRRWRQSSRPRARGNRGNRRGDDGRERRKHDQRLRRSRGWHSYALSVGDDRAVSASRVGRRHGDTLETIAEDDRMIRRISLTRLLILIPFAALFYSPSQGSAAGFGPSLGAASGFAALGGGPAAGAVTCTTST